MFIPRRCPLCEQPGPAPCVSCADGLRRCGPVPAVAGLDSITAVFAYEGSMRSVMLALKYRNRRDALPWLGQQMSAIVCSQHQQIDLVTWAPTSNHRAGRRGFDQAELLARSVAQTMRVPAVPLLRRCGRIAQTGLDAAARRFGPQFQPVARGSRRARGAGVLLVDDIVTTGATLMAAASALRRFEPAELHGIVAAHTPQHGRVTSWQA